MPIDPYHEWLGIPPDRRPPTYYDLLGISPSEQSRAVIEGAEVRQTQYVRFFQTGAYAEQATKILNEIANAAQVLLDADRRREYDAKLRPKAPMVQADQETVGLSRTAGGKTVSRKSTFEVEEPKAGPGASARRKKKAPTKSSSRFWIAGALVIGIVAVSIPILLRSSNSSSPAPQPPQRSAELASAPNPPQPPPQSVVVEKPPKSAPVVAVKPTAIEQPKPTPKADAGPAVFTLLIDPPDARLRIESEDLKSATDGDGSVRELRVENPDGVKSVRVILDKRGHEPLEKILIPKPGLRSEIALQLMRTGGAGKTNPPPAARSAPATWIAEPLTEINTPAANESGCWLSSDGLTIYWHVTKPGDTVGWIWSAQRVNSSAEFEKGQRLLRGFNATAADDSCEMLVFDLVGADQRLFEVRRNSTAQPFGQRKPVSELGSVAKPNSLALSSSGLDLFIDDGDGKLFYSTRTTRTSGWRRPKPLPVSLDRPSILKNPFVVRGEKVLFIVDRGPVAGNVGHLAVLYRERTSEPFSDMRRIDISSIPPFRSFPRYVEATRELFFSAGVKNAAGIVVGADIYVIRDFDPDALRIRRE